jgi:hypothetical protein
MFRPSAAGKQSPCSCRAFGPGNAILPSVAVALVHVFDQAENRKCSEQRLDRWGVRRVAGELIGVDRTGGEFVEKLAVKGCSTPRAMRHL